MNIFFRELKAHRKSIIIWSLVMILFVFMGMQKYSTMVGKDGNTEVLMNLINSMPSFLKAIWGISSLDIASPVGYYGMLFSYLALIGAIHAVTLGTGIIYKEERDKTVEFLMTKPVSRSRIVTSKIMAALVNVVIFNVVTFITSIIVLKGLTDESIAGSMILSILAMFFIQLLFLMIGIGAAAIMKKPKKAGSITMSILILAFLLSIVADLSSKLEMFKFLSPFKYFEAKSFLASSRLSMGYITLTLIIVITILIMSYREYNKRDLNM